ncbi:MULTISPECIES: TetR/AcrR family transcriptional regulator [Actinosynnema]|uniref:TetR/AcrR family transcriptional regulator n=1 Tax=Actinosynnema TaxID=40566 RepID=UPI0020A347A0|nr:TetR/AcrR family transcriptional regulator [Actinosynnema pretiosum]
MTVDDRPYHHGKLREALLDAAGRSVREHGVEQLSLRELAREVGVSHAAPRRHFPDRQALLDALAISGFERLDAELRTAVAGAGADYRDRLVTATRAYFRFAVDDPALLELMYTGKHRPGADAVVAAVEAPLGLLEELLAEGQERGELDAGDPERIGVLMFATVHGLAAMVKGQMVAREVAGVLVDDAVTRFLTGGGPGRAAVGDGGALWTCPRP